MFRTLISPPELASLPSGNHVLLDCRFELSRPQWGESAFAEGHLPGAHYVHLDRDLSAPITPLSGRHPLPPPGEFARRLGSWGVEPATQVVVYDQGPGMYAARLWWMLRWVGHCDVAVLDGGLAAWIAAGNPLSSDVAPVAASEPYPVHASAGASVDVDSLQRQLAAGRVLLVDGRGADRFAGQNETIDTVAGHVPGALNHPFTGNLDQQGRFLPAAKLRERWLTALAGRPAEDAVLMCGSGVSACHNLLALAHAGLGGARLFPGSWSEWIRDPSRPVATGSA